jgi:hypothetical protein
MIAMYAEILLQPFFDEAECKTKISLSPDVLVSDYFTSPI